MFGLTRTGDRWICRLVKAPRDFKRVGLDQSDLDRLLTRYPDPDKAIIRNRDLACLQFQFDLCQKESVQSIFDVWIEKLILTPPPLRSSSLEDNTATLAIMHLDHKQKRVIEAFWFNYVFPVTGGEEKNNRWVVDMGARLESGPHINDYVQLWLDKHPVIQVVS
jgi:hypothetical protein